MARTHPKHRTQKNPSFPTNAALTHSKRGDKSNKKGGKKESKRPRRAKSPPPPPIEAPEAPARAPEAPARATVPRTQGEAPARASVPRTEGATAPARASFPPTEVAGFLPDPSQNPETFGAIFPPLVSPQVNFSPPVGEITTHPFFNINHNFGGVSDDLSVAASTIQQQRNQIAFLQTQLANQEMSTVATTASRGKKRKSNLNEEVKNTFRKVIKQNIFNTTKFVSSDDQLLRLAYMVLKAADIPGFFTEAGGKFKPTPTGVHAAENFKSDIGNILNDCRQYASNQIKGVYFAYWDEKKRADPIDMKGLLQVLSRDPAVDQDLFAFYWANLIPKATGNSKLWPDERKFFGTLSTAAPPATPEKPYITPSTEAWLVLCIENNAVRWPKLWKQKKETPGVKLCYSKKGSAAKPGYRVLDTDKDDEWNGLYTNTDSGQKTYGGWSPDGLRRYRQLVGLCVQGRAKDTTPALEQQILDKIRAIKGITARTWEEHARSLRGGTGAPDPVEEIDGLVDEDEWELFEL